MFCFWFVLAIYLAQNVLSEYRYYDYEHNDWHPFKRYPPYQRLWSSPELRSMKGNHKSESDNEMDELDDNSDQEMQPSYDEPKPKPNDENSNVKSIVSAGKCLIKCFINWTKTCGGVLSCPWNCLFSDKPLPVFKANNKNDQDIVMETRDNSEIQVVRSRPNSNGLTPFNIIALTRCFTKCLKKYLPRNISGLTQLLSCAITRCFCKI